MNKMTRIAMASALITSFAAGEVYAAAEWNVSLWGKRRAFTENVEKLAELVEAKTNGDFKLNISYGGLSKSRENLDGIAIGAFEMAQFAPSTIRKRTRRLRLPSCLSPATSLWPALPRSIAKCTSTQSWLKISLAGMPPC